MWTGRFYGATATLLVPYDGSDASLDAVENAVEQSPDAAITVTRVIDRNYVESPY